MRYILLLTMCLSSAILPETSHATSLKTPILVDANPLVTSHTSCWYDNKRYSEGAIIYLQSHTLICAAKNQQHNNSPLIWHKADKQGNAIYPKKAKTITIN